MNTRKKLSVIAGPFAALLAMIALGSAAAPVAAGGFAEPVDEPKLVVPQIGPPSNAVRGCERFGQPESWEAVGEFCERQRNGLFAYAGYSFADEDIYIFGTRAPNTLPVLFYGPQDVSEDTKYPYAGVWFTHEREIAGTTILGPTLFHANLAFNLEASARSGRGMTLTSNAWSEADSSPQFYPGVVNEAWMRAGGFQIGIQPSRFDFIHTGYSLGESYTPKATTLAASYIFRPKKNLSIAFAAEDWSRRNREDGILARYGDQDVPDLVAQLRYSSGNVLYHAAVVRHQIEDATRPEQSDANGTASILAMEYKYSWSRILGNSASWLGLGGRVFGSVTTAKGAMGYLGTPFFATDYVADANGNLDLSRGQSVSLSVENVWRIDLRSMVTLSHFRTAMDTTSDLPYEEDMPSFAFAQSVEAKGTRLSLGIEKIAKGGTRYGLVGGYTWTSVSGEHNFNEKDIGVASFYGAKARSEYPDVMVYLSKRF